MLARCRSSVGATPQPRRSAGAGSVATENSAMLSSALGGIEVSVMASRRPKRGRPTYGKSPATSLLQVRVEPAELKRWREQARNRGEELSGVVREALRERYGEAK